MKKKLVSILVMTLLIGTGITVVNSVSACTGFTASDDENVLVGNNFDWSLDFNVYMNLFPAEEGKYGRIIFDIWWPWIGFDFTLPIQGMNDQGLFVDTYMTPEYAVDHSGAPFFESDDPDYYDLALWSYCLAKCSTVSEVLEIYTQYDQWWPNDISNGQVFFVDKNGDSIIIEDYDTIIFKEGDFQVVTNFLQSQPELGGHPCWRYDTAVTMLEDMTELTVDYFRSICDATHQSSSVFSNVYDLSQEIFYVNYNNNFEKTLEFDLNEELAKGERRIHIGSLFDSEENNPPDKPDAPTGEASGEPGIDYEFKGKKTNDPDGDRTMYLFDWGDGTESAWLTPGRLGGTFKATHNWTERGTYEIRIKGKDVYGRESEWSDPLSVTMPRNKAINRPFLNFLENHPNLFPILQKLLQRLVQ